VAAGTGERAFTEAIVTALASRGAEARIVAKDPLAYFIRSLLREAAGVGDGAVAELTTAIELAPTAGYLWNSRALVRRRRSDFAVLARAIELFPRNPVRWLNRSDVLVQRGELARALDDAQRAVELDPGYAVAIATRGKARLRLGDVSPALADFDRAIELDPRA